MFDSLILSFSVWGSACQKYLGRIDNFCKWAYILIWKYTTQADFKIWTLLEDKDNLLFKKITTMHEKQSTSRSVAAKMDKNTKEKGAWISTLPDKNWNIQKPFYEQMSSFLNSCDHICYVWIFLFISFYILF